MLKIEFHPWRCNVEPNEFRLFARFFRAYAARLLKTYVIYHQKTLGTPFHFMNFSTSVLKFFLLSKVNFLTQFLIKGLCKHSFLNFDTPLPFRYHMLYHMSSCFHHSNPLSPVMISLSMRKFILISRNYFFI